MTDNQFSVQSNIKFSVEGANVAATQIKGIGDASSQAKSGIDQAQIAASALQSALKLNVGQAGAMSAKMKSLVSDLTSFGGVTAAQTDIVQGLSAQIGSLDRVASLDRIIQSFSEMARTSGDVNRSIAQMRTALREVGASSVEIDRATSAVRAQGGKAGRFNVGGFLSNAAQLSGLPGLNVANDVEGVISSLGGLSTASVAAAGALAGLAVIMQQINNEFDKGRKLLATYTEGEAFNLNLRLNGAAQLKSATVEQVQNEIDLASKRRTILQEEINQRQADIARVKAQYDALGASFDPIQRAVLGDAGKLLEQQLAELQKQFDEESKVVEYNTAALLPAVVARESETKAIEAQKKAQQELTDLIRLRFNQATELAFYQDELRGQTTGDLEKQRADLEKEAAIRRGVLLKFRDTLDPEQIKQSEEQINLIQAKIDMINQYLGSFSGQTQGDFLANQQKAIDATKEYAQVLLDLSATEKRYADILAKRARDDARNAQISALQSRIDTAKQREEVEARNQKLSQLRVDYNRQEFEAFTNYQKSRAKIEDDARKAALKLDEDYALNRKRKLEDLTADLEQLAAKGDVASFVNRLSTGTRDLARGDEDYQRQRSEIGRNRQEQLNDLVIAYTEERTKRQEQLNERLIQEVEAGQIRLTESARLERELQALRARFAEEDKREQRRIEDEALRSDLEALRRRRDQLSPIVRQSLEPAVNAVVNFGNSISNYFNQLAAAWNSYIVPQRTTTSGTTNAITGATTTGGGATGGVTVSFAGANFGQVATPADLAALEQAVVRGIQRARTAS